MRIQFWGTRGSIATPGPRTTRYGGNTSCIEVRSALGTVVIIDCGTGAYPLGQHLISGGANGLRGHILISHTHWDHIQGIPFFEPLFARGTEWDIYGPKSLGASLREALAGQMQYNYFPVTLDHRSAKIRYHDLVEGSFDIDDIKVSAQYLNHPVLTLGYRLEADGMSVVYACDHEPHSRMLAIGDGDITGQDLRHAEFIEGADLLIHDAQYTVEEYSEKHGWGHSPVEYVVKLSQYARVKRTALTHHDPFRDDDAIDRLTARLQRKVSSPNVFAAFEGQVVELGTSSGKSRARRGMEVDAKMPIQPELGQRTVLVCTADPTASAVLREVLRADSICFKTISDVDTASTDNTIDRPWMAILEHNPPCMNGMEMCQVIRGQAKDDRLPVLIVADGEDQHAGAAAGITDWLIKPFTPAYARTKIRAWLLRAACQSIKAGEGEEQPQILNSEPVNGFDGTAHHLAKEEEKRSEKAALLWMYGREIASFETPAFTKNAGEIIAQATAVPQTRAARHRKMKGRLAQRESVRFTCERS